MKKKLIFCICIILCVVMCAGSIPFSAYTYSCDVEVTSRAVLVANLNTDTFVYEKNSTGIRYLSYLTNIMTYIVVRNNVADIEEKVVIKNSVLDAIENPDNSLDKYAGKKLSVEDLLHFILLTDCKDAAYVLADYVSKGDINAFVELMNKKAKTLGCKKTVFTAPSVVEEPTQYTTCQDLYKIMKCAIDTPDYVRISGTLSYIPAGSKNKKNTIKNTNSMINEKSPYYFKHIDHGKYSTDKVARGNVVCVSEFSDVEYVCIVLGAEVKSEHNAFTESRQLLSWAYTTLGNQKIILETDILATAYANAPWGEIPVELTAGKDVERTVPTSYDAEKLTYEASEEVKVDLPVFKGQNMGTATIYYDGKFYDKIDMISSKSVGISFYEDISSFLGAMFNATVISEADTEQTDEAAQAGQ